MNIYYYSEGRCKCFDCYGYDFEPIEGEWVKCTQCGNKMSKKGLLKEPFESEFKFRTPTGEMEKQGKMKQPEDFIKFSEGMGTYLDPHQKKMLERIPRLKMECLTKMAMIKFRVLFPFFMLIPQIEITPNGVKFSGETYLVCKTPRANCLITGIEP